MQQTRVTLRRNKLRVDGPFVIGRLAGPEGALDNPVGVEIFLDGAKAGLAIVDKVAGKLVPGRAAGLSSFEFRIHGLAPELRSPIISARAPFGGVPGSVAWNADSRRMARWMYDTEQALSKPCCLEEIASIAENFQRFAKWHPLVVLRNKRATAAIVRDIAISLSVIGFPGKAARLLVAFPLFAFLRSSDVALYETLRTIADVADWRDKRKLAAVLAAGGLGSDTAGAFARRMRLSRDGPAGKTDAAWFRRMMNDAGANPVLRAFAAESLALHTREPLVDPR
jgi:hypothetical protein